MKGKVDLAVSGVPHRRESKEAAGDINAVDHVYAGTSKGMDGC